MQWSLDAQGIMLRSWWDVYSHIKDGSLINVLPDYKQSANIWAVYPERISESEKMNKCIEFLSEYFSKLSEQG
ncbi:Putative transcriptional regulator LYSR-type [Salmonella enterica subsp. indica]|uniref:Transcriptional regulator LYSR-type n=2 Tax=Salmonella enterica TaxID=28901 RepID=A0A379XJX8_SALER|nr:Putative transcriptional regulator LYSR-type [Salmonella enterica subsp. indica]